MTQTTVLAPWFVVQRLLRCPFPAGGDDAVLVSYYSTDEENQTIWTDDTHKAMLFMSLHSAYRVARATAGEIRVLADKDDLTEFRPKGEI